MRAVKVTVCPSCETVIEKDDPDTVRYQCSECEELYEDRDDAKDCCKD